MESKSVGFSSHRDWRRLAKKERRRRVRRKNARERDADDERLRATLERSANYTNWLADQEKLEKERESVEQREHDEKEKLWLEEEIRSQREWRIHQERKAKARQEQIRQEEIIRKEFEAKQESLRMKKEENKRRYEEEAKKHEDMRKQIDDYIDDGANTPEILRNVTESQSGKEPCPFFTKTGACRYGESCSRNHRRLALTKVILVPGFYNHFSLEKNSAEYDTDISLEYESSETLRHFREFYDEVVPELEKFGRIETLKYCCNSEIHLRGNLYVEYRSEREAARAWRKLKGRYWAGRQLNCEFVDLKSWRDAVCGMTKCPKGRACNFLHTFRNPHDEYDIKSPPRWAKKKNAQWDSSCSSSRRSEHRSTSKWDDMDRENTDESRNWRWSESPETESKTRGKSDETRREIRERGERRRSSKSERRREDESERSSSRNSLNDVDSHRRKNSSSRLKRRHDEHENKNETRNGDSSSRRSSKKSKKSRRKRDDESLEESELSKPHRRNERITDRTSRRKSRMENEEFDENVDANLNECRTSVEKLENRNDERNARIGRARWDDIQTNADSEHDERRNTRDSATNEEAETMTKTTIKKRRLSIDEM